MTMADLFAVAPYTGPAVAPVVTVELPGPPRGKGRPRFRVVTPRGGKPFASVYTDAETVAYEEALGWRGKAAMHGRPLFLEPLAVRVFAMMPIPPSWSKRDREAAARGEIVPACKPDEDNISKIAKDALNGIVWGDDAQIVVALVVKEYATHPGLIVEVFRAQGRAPQRAPARVNPRS